MKNPLEQTLSTYLQISCNAKRCLNVLFSFLMFFDELLQRFAGYGISKRRFIINAAFGAVVALATTITFSQQVQENLWTTNGAVSAVLPSPDGSTIYIGGYFTYVGPTTGSGAAIDSSTGNIDSGMPRVAGGWINAVVPDGSGGWYIGGGFSSVGGTARGSIAHIKSDKTVDANFNPNADNEVYAIALSGSTVYVGGHFTSIGGETRNRIAALDAATGLATSFNPNVNSVVNALALSGSTLYAAGQFTNIGGVTRNRIAAIDAATGLATSWNPNANGFNAIVLSLALSGSTVYAGGNFTSIGGETRNNIAALDAATGLATSWNPNANANYNPIPSMVSFVRALAVSGSTVYAGGYFTSIGGQTRNSIAALDAATGNATSFNTNAYANGYVIALAVSGSTMYAAGDFAPAGISRFGIVAFDAATGNATSFNPGSDKIVRALALSGSTVYAGGDFTSVGGVTRHNIAAIDAATGKATSFDPNADNAVVALALSGSTVYAGGYFTSIGGETRNYIAALDAVTGLATSWNPNATSERDGVLALAVSGSTVYAGGDFTSIGGETRNNIAALDAVTGLATSWNPNANDPWGSGEVWALALSGSTVYAGGNFINIGGETRNRIAALDATTGLATSWNPDANEEVSELALSGSTVYAGGAFTSIGGQTRNGFAALDAATGLATSFDPNAGGVATFAVSGSTVYAGGGFTSIGGETRNYIAALDAATGLATSWNPDVSGEGGAVYALALSGSTVYAGGYFTTIMGEFSNGFVGLTAANPTNTPAGMNIVVLPVDLTTGTAPVTVTFDNVSQAGTTSLSVSQTGPSPPSGFRLGAPPTYYELATTALFSGSITACINYTETSYGNEADLKLFHLEGGAWVDQTISLDIDNNIICASVTSLSPFAIFESEPGNIVGSASVNSNGIAGVTVKLLDENGLPVTGIDPANTDTQGDYSFANLPAHDYQVMIVEPLGYFSDGNPKQTILNPGGTNQVNFALTPVTITNNSRSMGYWKQQYDKYITNRGHAQETEAQLNQHIGGVHQYYTPHFDVFSGLTTFSQWQAVLSKTKHGTMLDKARQHLAALVMNFTSVKIGQNVVVTADGRTAGDALTYVSTLVTGGDASKYELAKNLAEQVCTQQTIGAGIVPAGNVLYKGGSGQQINWNFDIPTVFTLLQNYPNPFNPTTTIEYQLAAPGNVRLSIFNILGEEIARLADGDHAAGYYSAVWDAGAVPSGVYYARIAIIDPSRNELYRRMTKLVLLK